MRSFRERVEGRSVPGYTPTNEGDLPHKKHPAGFFMPVLVCSRMRGRHDVLPAPVRTDGGRLIYALPGGGQWIDRKGVR